MSIAISVGFFLLSLLHVPPAISAFRPEMMATLYGPAAADGGVGILLHHRAMMFVLVAGACLAAAVVPAIRQPVLILTGWSMLTYLVAYATGGLPSGALARVALADLAGVPVFLFLMWAVWVRSPVAP